eukprot:s3839_g8.t1
MGRGAPWRPCWAPAAVVSTVRDSDIIDLGLLLPVSMRVLGVSSLQASQGHTIRAPWRGLDNPTNAKQLSVVIFSTAPTRVHQATWRLWKARGPRPTSRPISSLSGLFALPPALSRKMRFLVSLLLSSAEFFSSRACRCLVIGFRLSLVRCLPTRDVQHRDEEQVVWNVVDGYGFVPSRVA